MYFSGDDGYWIVRKKVTNWISTGISSEKIKPFDTNLEATCLI